MELTYKERVVRGNVQSEHIVQLFDTPESLADTVATFLQDGYTRGETLLLAITPRHWVLTAALLERGGCSIAEAMSSAQLTVVDAAAMINQFMRDGRPDPILFDEVIGGIVRVLNARGAPLRIYGEMVDLLAFEGDFVGAFELEELWNALGEREPFRLFCGYSTAHFGNPRSGGALRQICQTHSHVRTSPRDILSSFLLDASARSHAAGLKSHAT